MAGKKKPLRTSSRLNAKGKVVLSSTTAPEDATPLVEPVSPTSSSGEASSTSGDYLALFNVLELGGKFKDYEN